MEQKDLANIHTAILKVYESVGYVQKQSKRGLSYSYAGEASLIRALRPSMIENGIVVSVSEVRDFTQSTYQTKSGTSMNHAVLVVEVTFTHAPSGTFVKVMTTGEGSDTGDKSFNKAMTGAYKYALRQTFMIETGDDPDDHSSDEMERASNGKKKTSKKSSGTPLSPLHKEVVDLCTTLGGSSNEALMAVVNKHVSNGNPNTIKDEDKLKALRDELVSKQDQIKP